MTELQKIKDKIIVLQNQQVILDSDVAEIYGVETKRINEAVKNNTAYLLRSNCRRKPDFLNKTT